MTTLAPIRISTTEYAEKPRSLREIAEEAKLPVAAVAQALRDTSERLRRELQLPGLPIQIRDEEVVVEDVAGLVRVLPGLVLEIAPKFLGHDAPSWRQDFFFVAVLTRFGRILPRERIPAGYGPREDLATLVAQAIVGMYWANHRRPLRQYRRRRWQDFALDGDVDAESILVPDPDGYEQEGTFLERRNEFNATIRGAVGVLLPEVRHGSTRAQLVRVFERLSPQAVVQRAPPAMRLPSRHRRWQSTFDLAREVLHGLGVHYAGSRLLAPGFVLKTADAWQDLLLVALQYGASGLVVTKRSYELGLRDGKPSSVTPDMTVERAGTRLLLADAKYRTRIEKAPDVASADLYESLAFLSAAGLDRMVLVYPSRRPERDSVGNTRIFETFQRAQHVVTGVEIECRGISGRGGFRAFARGLAEEFVRQATPTRT